MNDDLMRDIAERVRADSYGLGIKDRIELAVRAGYAAAAPAPPREPTQRMMDAAEEYLDRPDSRDGVWQVQELWQQMYDAAPAPTVAQPAEPLKNRVSDGSRQFPPHRDPGRVSPSVEKSNDDESNGRRTRWMAGESDEGHVQTGGGDGARGRDCPGEHGAGLLHSQQHADPRRGNGTRAFPILIDNEALRQQIAADPDDSEPSAGNAEPPATDDLVRDLNDWVRTFAYDAPLRRCIERGTDTIVALRAENERQAREIAEWYRIDAMRNQRVIDAQAERDALRTALQAAIKAMNDECLHYAQYGEQPPQHLLDAIDAARAKVKE